MVTSARVLIAGVDAGGRRQGVESVIYTFTSESNRFEWGHTESISPHSD